MDLFLINCLSPNVQTNKVTFTGALLKNNACDNWLPSKKLVLTKGHMQNFENLNLNFDAASFILFDCANLNVTMTSNVDQVNVTVRDSINIYITPRSYANVIQDSLFQ